MTIIYKYIGRGDALIHVPTQDLTEADLAERAELWKENGITEELLVTSGLYEKVEATLDIEFEYDSIATAETQPIEKRQPKTKKAAKDGE